MFGGFGQQNQNQNQGQSGTPSIFGNTQQGGQNQPSGGTSLFGNTQQPSTGTGTSPFGNTGGGTGSSLFGNTQQQQHQPAAGGGLFGNTGATNQQQSSGNSLFGNPSTNTQQPAGGNLFGNTGTNATQPAGGNLFGNTPSTNTGGSLFGNMGTGMNANQPQQQGSSLFGNTGTTSAQQPSTSQFGNTGTQQSTGSNLFGNPNTNTQNTQQSSGGGLFGNPQPSGSMFGNSSTNSAAQSSNAGTGLFGQSTNTNPLFGNKPPTTLFGQPQQQQQQQQSGPGASTTTSSLFGQSTNPGASLFGQSTQQQQQQQQQKPQGSLFGGGNSLFGSTLGQSTSNNFLASRAGNASSQQQADPQAQFAALSQRIEGVAQAWNSSSPQCRFQHYFYNLVDPGTARLYGRPPNAVDESLWQRAVRENPNPECLVPVLAVGFDDLRLRVDAQSKQAANQQEQLKELQKRLRALAELHQDSNTSRLQRAAQLQVQISHRLMQLIQHLHLLIPAVRSSSLTPEEEALRVALEEMEEDIRRPGGASKMRGKLNELWALVGAVTAARERGRKAGTDSQADWAVVDEEGLKQIAQILADQQAGIQHLTKVLQRNQKDLAVIYGQTPEAQEYETVKDDLFSSTSTLRLSTLR